MIKFIPFLAVLLVFSMTAVGQNDQKIVIASQYDTPEFRDLLIERALINFPNYLIEEQNAIIADLEHTMTAYDILNQITISGNLNESAIDPPASDVVTNVYYPRYNLGVVIPLGLFVKRRLEVKIATRKLSISNLNVEQASLELRRQVLSVFNNYLLAENIFRIKNEITEDANANFITMEDKYENGEVTLAEYNFASKTYKLELEKSLTARTQMDNIKLELEMWIGSKLEDVDLND